MQSAGYSHFGAMTLVTNCLAAIRCMLQIAFEAIH
jgi:hypothetical protein